MSARRSWATSVYAGIRLITNNPAKFGGLDGYGLTVVGRVALPAVETPHNVRYLRTKRDRMGHVAGDPHRDRLAA